DLLQQQAGVDRTAVGQRRVHRRDNGLFDLGAGKALGGRGQRGLVEAFGRQLAPAQVQLEHVGAGVGVGQVDEEDLVEAALAQQFGRQFVHLVGGGDQEH